MEINILGIMRVVVCAVSTLFCILAMALPSWVSQDVTYTTGTGKTTTTNIGLWKSCDEDSCTPTVVSAAMVLLTGFMVSLGVILLIGTLVCAVLTNVIKNAMLVYVGGILAAFAGLLQLIAFSAFADYMAMIRDSIKDKEHVTASFGAAFGLDIVTCILSLVTAVLFIGPQLRAIPDS